MSKPAKRAAKPHVTRSSALPENPPVSPRIPQRYSQHSLPPADERAQAAVHELARAPKEPPIDTERLLALERICEAQDLYLVDGNPLWMWLAIAAAHDAGLA